jgi:hypothetical protein
VYSERKSFQRERQGKHIKCEWGTETEAFSHGDKSKIENIKVRSSRIQCESNIRTLSKLRTPCIRRKARVREMVFEQIYEYVTRIFKVKVH